MSVFHACIWESGTNCKQRLSKLGGNLTQVVVKSSSPLSAFASPVSPLFLLSFSLSPIHHLVFFPFHPLFCLCLLTSLTSFFMSCSFFFYPPFTLPPPVPLLSYSALGQGSQSQSHTEDVVTKEEKRYGRGGGGGKNGIL